MNYLVSAENTPHYHWQLELLIESFKHHHLEDDLLVCLSVENAPVHPMYTRNILSHKNVKIKENTGLKRGYTPLNSLYDAYWAASQGWINQPFIQIPSHSILYQPLEIKNSKYPEITYSPDPFLYFEEAEKNIGPFWEVLSNPKEYYQEYWLPVGNFVAYNNLPSEFFSRAILIAEKLIVMQILNNKPIWDKTIQLAIACNMSDAKEDVIFKRDAALSINMLEFNKAPFIDYEHGMPPVFNKKLFKFSPPDYISLGEPFSALIENPSTPPAYFMSQLAEICVEQ